MGLAILSPHSPLTVPLLVLPPSAVPLLPLWKALPGCLMSQVGPGLSAEGRTSSKEASIHTVVGGKAEEGEGVPKALAPPHLPKIHHVAMIPKAEHLLFLPGYPRGTQSSTDVVIPISVTIHIGAPGGHQKHMHQWVHDTETCKASSLGHRVTPGQEHGPVQLSQGCTP